MRSIVIGVAILLTLAAITFLLISIAGIRKEKGRNNEAVWARYAAIVAAVFALFTALVAWDVIPIIPPPPPPTLGERFNVYDQTAVNEVINKINRQISPDRGWAFKEDILRLAIYSSNERPDVDITTDDWLQFINTLSNINVPVANLVESENQNVPITQEKVVYAETSEIPEMFAFNRDYAFVKAINEKSSYIVKGVFDGRRRNDKAFQKEAADYLMLMNDVFDKQKPIKTARGDINITSVSTGAASVAGHMTSVPSQICLWLLGDVNLKKGEGNIATTVLCENLAQATSGFDEVHLQKIENLQKAEKK